MTKRSFLDRSGQVARSSESQSVVKAVPRSSQLYRDERAIEARMPESRVARVLRECRQAGGPDLDSKSKSN